VFLREESLITDYLKTAAVFNRSPKNRSGF